MSLRLECEKEEGPSLAPQLLLPAEPSNSHILDTPRAMVARARNQSGGPLAKSEALISL